MLASHLPFLYICSLFFVLACALDTITPSLLIQEPATISSNNSRFTLGFFSPENSTNRYLGIWFMTKSTIVWVANRNDPLTGSSGVLKISKNGNLVVLNGKNKVVWSTLASHVASNSSAQLLDSGNLVLVDGITGAMMWQSFQHPCDTILQGLKLSTNKKTGEKVQLISWKSTSDPSYGEFSCSLEPRGNVTEIVVWKGNNPYRRSGPWDGRNFLGLHESLSMIGNGIQVNEEEGSVEGSFHFIDKSLLLIYKLDSDGESERQRWNFQKNIWEVELIFGDFECDAYGKCGPFGICNKQTSPICSCLKGFEPKNKEEWERQNWTSGCVRREALQCERDNNVSQGSQIDGFWKLERVKLPDHAERLPYNFTDTIDCPNPCLKKCSCKAYAYDPGLGCLFWSVDLVDLISNLPVGADLYVRLGSSELAAGKRNKTTTILISVLTGIILITASGFFLWKKWSKQKGEKYHKLKQVQIQEASFFDFRKLAAATNNFNITNKLGQGGYGPVYKGKFNDGQEIAIKRLSKSSGQGVEEFVNEVELISKLQHRNLVKLLGCCIEEEEILVYEYLPNKSLDTYIFDPSQQKCLGWEKRFNIIEGIARGLLYLHRDLRLRIVHRDLKASNILLDEGMNPKISDFGMAKHFRGGQNQANTKRIVGTFGYISPEYAAEGLYSEKSDVFSFGVLLLEIISGRKNTSFYKDAESLTLLGFAWKLWIDANVMPLIDPQIYDASFFKDILRCTHIGLLCVQELAKDRPTMASVMSMLQREKYHKLKQVQIQEASFYDFRKLAAATNNFDITNQLEQGGYGPVYKGKFNNGQEIALKRLSKSSSAIYFYSFDSVVT